MDYITLLEREAEGARKFVRFGQLERNKEYKVVKMRFKAGIFDRQVAIDLDNGEWTCLPQHAADLIVTEADLETVNAQGYILIYKGMDISKGNMHKFSLVPTENYNIKIPKLE